MSSAFSLRQISKSYGDDTLFDGLSIEFKTDEQIGIVGSNGSGKSTLLKIIAGRVEPDTGERVARKGFRIAFIEQEDRFDPEKSVEQILYDALAALPFDEAEKHKIIQSNLGKAGFSDPTAPCRTLSGGWLKKLAITQALCTQPDILLLDEPTNHLDINGILWLESVLKSAKFSFILVSHDRAFLENVCRTVMEIGRFYPDGYFKIAGGYNQFDKEKEKLLLAQQKQQDSLSSKMRREEEWLRQGPKARTSKARFRIDQAHALRTQLEQLKRRNRAVAQVDLNFTATGRQTKKLVRAFDISKSIVSKPLFSSLTFELTPGFCLGVVGVNGSGKSTFLNILEQTSEPDTGKVTWAQDLKVAVFDQHRLALNPEHTLKQALHPEGSDSVHYNGRSVHIVTWAKRFLFMPDQLDMPVSRLSGGEKARVMLANIMLRPCDVLLLDEPTNDLDILSLEVLEESISQFPGAVVIVSHDRYLMDRVCHRMLYLEPNKDAQFFKDFSQILKHREKPLEKKRIKPKAAPKKTKSHAFSFKDKYELDHIEEHILAAEEDAGRLEALIQAPEIINDREKMEHHCQELENAQAEVQRLYDRWETLEAKKAQAENE